MRYALGIDLGGTKTAAGVVDEDGQVLASDQIPTSARDGAAVILDATAKLVLSLAGRAEADGIVLEGIGIGSAGVIDAKTGTVVSATDAIRSWAGTPITAELAARTGLECDAVNDVHAHALGEYWVGAARGVRSALLVAVGTGVGGSYVVDGSPLQGARSVAGHVGHIASPYAYNGTIGRPCTCGGAGHVEAVASGPAILETYLRQNSDQPPARDTREVCARAAAGDPTAHRAVTIGAAAVGQAIGGLANVLDPDVVVVSGGMASAGPLWWNTMSHAAAVELLRPLSGIPVVPAALGTNAAIVGAARLPLTRKLAKVGP